MLGPHFFTSRSKKVSPAGTVAGTATTAPALAGSAAAAAAAAAPAAATAPGTAPVAAVPAAATTTSAKGLANTPLAALLAGATAKSSSSAAKTPATVAPTPAGPVAPVAAAPVAAAPVATPAAAPGVVPVPQSAVDPTLAKHLRSLVAASRFDDAFVAALEAQNLAAVHFVCELVDPVMLFGVRPLLLQTTTTLALIHQLSVGWDPTSDLQLSYMRRALQTMEAPDHRAREVLRTVALQLRSRPLPPTASDAQRQQLNTIVGQLIPLLQAPAQ